MRDNLIRMDTLKFGGDDDSIWASRSSKTKKKKSVKVSGGGGVQNTDFSISSSEVDTHNLFAASKRGGGPKKGSVNGRKSNVGWSSVQPNNAIVNDSSSSTSDAHTGLFIAGTDDKSVTSTEKQKVGASDDNNYSANRNSATIKKRNNDDKDTAHSRSTINNKMVIDYGDEDN